MGSYSPPPSTGGQSSIIQELSILRNDLLEIPIGTLEGDPIILKQWNIIRSGSPDPNFTLTPYFGVLAQGRRTAGAGNVRIGVAEQFDGLPTWFGASTIPFNTGSFVADISSSTINILDQTNTGIALVAYNTNGTTSGELKAISAVIRAIFAPDDIVTEVV